MKMKLITASVIVWILCLNFLTTETAAQQKGRQQRRGGPQGGPPPEALNACQNLNEGASCQFESPHGTISGSCQNIHNQMACVPEGMSPGGPQGRQRNDAPQRQGGQSDIDKQRPTDRQHQQQTSQSSSPSKPYKGAIRLTNNLNDTGQYGCYNNSKQISCPSSGKAFYGQDAHYQSKAFAFQDNSDGTISDLNTGLMWQKTPDLESKSSYIEAVAGVKDFALAGYDDWRLPTLKELYSLIDFKGSSMTETPYIDTDYFDFVFGDESKGERLIDAQYWTSTEYVGTTFNGSATVFGVNFADGRIKGYPRDAHGRNQGKRFVRYVRGDTGYGVNDFSDNGDGTISDRSTGLMWQKVDSGTTMNWKDALEYAENLEYAGHDDWRLPNAKELQSIVDYSRAPDAQNPDQRGPAIDPLFDISETESWFWTSTTLLETPPDRGSGSHAVYVTFGQAFGYMEDRRTGSKTKMNVHGAGAQRSDPKDGNPADWAGGHGPQGDEIRIYNYVRCVRDIK